MPVRHRLKQHLFGIGCLIVAGHQVRERLARDLLAFMAVHALGAVAPFRDPSFFVDEVDAIVLDRVDHQAIALLAAKQLRGVLAHPLGKVTVGLQHEFLGAPAIADVVQLDKKALGRTVLYVRDVVDFIKAALAIGAGALHLESLCLAVERVGDARQDLRQVVGADHLVQVGADHLMGLLAMVRGVGRVGKPADQVLVVVGQPGGNAVGDGLCDATVRGHACLVGVSAADIDHGRVAADELAMAIAHSRRSQQRVKAAAILAHNRQFDQFCPVGFTQHAQPRDDQIAKVRIDQVQRTRAEQFLAAVTQPVQQSLVDLDQTELAIQ